MKGARVMILSKKVRERQIPYDFTHMWNLRNKTSKADKKEKEQTGDYQRGFGWGDGLNR